VFRPAYQFSRYKRFRSAFNRSVDKLNSPRPRKIPTSIEQRRYAAGLRLRDVAQLTGFTVSKMYRIEKNPLAARARDLAAVDAAISSVEVAIKGDSKC
jgi:hypothetical protein